MMKPCPSASERSTSGSVPNVEIGSVAARPAYRAEGYAVVLALVTT